MLQHIYSELIDIKYAIGRIEGTVHGVHHSVRCVQREVRAVKRARPRRGVLEWWPAISGLLVLGLAAAGKLEWSEAVKLLLAGAGG